MTLIREVVRLSKPIEFPMYHAIKSVGDREVAIHSVSISKEDDEAFWIELVIETKHFG